MPRGKKLKVAFKANHQHQIMAFPPTLDELVPTDHPVRVVNDVLERIDISALVADRDEQTGPQYDQPFPWPAAAEGTATDLYTGGNPAV